MIITLFMSMMIAYLYFFYTSISVAITLLRYSSYYWRLRSAFRLDHFDYWCIWCLSKLNNCMRVTNYHHNYNKCICFILVSRWFRRCCWHLCSCYLWILGIKWFRYHPNSLYIYIVNNNVNYLTYIWFLLILIIYHLIFILV